MKKIALFGGTFDPIHFGHLHLALEMSERHGLDEVLFVPANLSPFKQQTPPAAAAADRLEMVRLGVAPIDTFSVLDWEIKRGGVSYTIDTLLQLQAESSELYLILADELLEGIHGWHRSEELLQMCRLLTGGRSPNAKMPVLEISSTWVRERIGSGKYCGHLVPAPVLQYIQANRLYQS